MLDNSGIICYNIYRKKKRKKKIGGSTKKDRCEQTSAQRGIANERTATPSPTSNNQQSEVIQMIRINEQFLTNFIESNLEEIDEEKLNEIYWALERASRRFEKKYDKLEGEIGNIPDAITNIEEAINLLPSKGFEEIEKSLEEQIEKIKNNLKIMEDQLEDLGYLRDLSQDALNKIEEFYDQ